MMDRTYWHKQTTDKPLYPELLWSRPENRQHAGKLLIVGGNGYEFKSPANAYGDALDAGIGVAKVLLPDSMQKVVRDIFPEAEFAPSTPSGSFSKRALAELMSLSEWADGVLLAGDFGRNSETAILLEDFMQAYRGPLTLTKDALDYFTKTPQSVLRRPMTTLVLSLSQLQQLAAAAPFKTAITFDMDLPHLVEALHAFTEQFPLNIVVKHLQTIFVAVSGQVSTTKLAGDLELWRLRTAVHASVWLAQLPQKPFQALTASLT